MSRQDGHGQGTGAGLTTRHETDALSDLSMWGDPDEPAPERQGAYWLGMVVLVPGLIAVVGALATRVTSIVQTVLLAVPLALVGLGLERVGHSMRRGGLRTVGVLLLVVAIAGPVLLSLTSPGAGVITREQAAVPPGASQARLRVDLGGGELRVDGGADGLYRAELRSPGRPTAEETSRDKLALVSLRGPRQRGLIARNRGSDWTVGLSTGLPWELQVNSGALTGDLDLRSLDVRAVDVDAGPSRLALRLGEPAAEVAVSVRISAGFVDIHLPRATDCEVRVDGLAINNFEDEGLVQEGGVWRTVDAGRSGGRYRIDVDATLARVRLHRY